MTIRVSPAPVKSKVLNTICQNIVTFYSYNKYTFQQQESENVTCTQYKSSFVFVFNIELAIISLVQRRGRNLWPVTIMSRLQKSRALRQITFASKKYEITIPKACNLLQLRGETERLLFLFSYRFRFVLVVFPHVQLKFKVHVYTSINKHFNLYNI